MAKRQAEYCMYCGSVLEKRYNEEEQKAIPYCGTCGEFRFPVFSTAVVMIIQNAKQDRHLMIRQFGDHRYYLVSGYVDQGETAEEAVKREVMEEVGLITEKIQYLTSCYYEESNTLMLNYLVTAKEDPVHINSEVDDSAWIAVGLVEKTEKHPLAEYLLNKYFHS